jgi:hypothetical protein
MSWKGGIAFNAAVAAGFYAGRIGLAIVDEVRRRGGILRMRPSRELEGLTSAKSRLSKR